MAHRRKSRSSHRTRCVRDEFRVRCLSRADLPLMVSRYEEGRRRPRYYCGRAGRHLRAGVAVSPPLFRRGRMPNKGGTVPSRKACPTRTADRRVWPTLGTEVRTGRRTAAFSQKGRGSSRETNTLLTRLSHYYTNRKETSPYTPRGAPVPAPVAKLGHERRRRALRGCRRHPLAS